MRASSSSAGSPSGYSVGRLATIESAHAIIGAAAAMAAAGPAAGVHSVTLMRPAGRPNALTVTPPPQPGAFAPRIPRGILALRVSIHVASRNRRLPGQGRRAAPEHA